MTVDHGDNTFYWKVAGYVGLIVLGLMAVARLLAWYVFRFGRMQLDAQTRQSDVAATAVVGDRVWKPVLMLLVLIYAFSAVPVAYMWWDELRTVRKLPVVTAADAQDHVGDYFRVGGEPVW
jgi:hypothetical protein